MRRAVIRGCDCGAWELVLSAWLKKAGVRWNARLTYAEKYLASG